MSSHHAVTLAMSGADVGQDSFPVTMEDSDAENEDDEGTTGVSRVYISSLVATISLRSQDGDNLGERLDEPLKISFSTSKVKMTSSQKYKKKSV